ESSGSERLGRDSRYSSATTATTPPAERLVKSRIRVRDVVTMSGAPSSASVMVWCDIVLIESTMRTLLPRTGVARGTFETVDRDFEGFSASYAASLVIHCESSLRLEAPGVLAQN